MKGFNLCKKTNGIELLCEGDWLYFFRELKNNLNGNKQPLKQFPNFFSWSLWEGLNLHVFFSVGSFLGDLLVPFGKITTIFTLLPVLLQGLCATTASWFCSGNKHSFNIWKLNRWNRRMWALAEKISCSSFKLAQNVYLTKSQHMIFQTFCCTYHQSRSSLLEQSSLPASVRRKNVSPWSENGVRLAL